jgi:hypothetical protein
MISDRKQEVFKDLSFIDLLELAEEDHSQKVYFLLTEQDQLES